MFLEEEFVQICAILKTTQKVFTCISAISVVTYKQCCGIGRTHHTLVLVVYRVASNYAETF